MTDLGQEPNFSEILDEEVKKLRSSIKSNGAAHGRPAFGTGGADNGEWPQIQTLQNELPPVQAFGVDLLPESFRPLVSDVAERMQVPMDYPAVVVVLCLRSEEHTSELQS